MKRFVVFAVIAVTMFLCRATLIAQQEVPHPAAAMQAAPSDGFKAAMRLYRQRRYAEAIQAFDTLVQSEPNNAAAYYFKGYAQYVTRQFPESVASFEQAFQTDPALDPRPYFHRR